MEKNKTLAENAIYNVIYKCLNVLFPIVSSMYTSRVLLPEGTGIIAYAQNIVAYFIALANLGIPTYGVREIAKCKGNQNNINKLFSELFFLNMISTVICVCLYLGMILISGYFADLRKLYLVFSFMIALNIINIDWFYQGKENYKYIAIRSVIIKSASLICLFLFVKSQNDYLKYAVILCLATGGNYIFNIVHSRNFVSVLTKGLQFHKHLKPVFVMFICFLAVDLYGKVDTTMLGNMCTKAVVGFYSNSQKIVNLVITLTTAISSVFLPRLSFLYQQDKEQFDELVSKGLEIVVFFATPCFLGMELVARDLIPVFWGEAFSPAVITTQLLAVLILLKSVGDLLCYQVIMSAGKEKVFMITFIVGAGINVVLNRIMIAKFLQNGAAVASVASELFVNVVLISYALKVVDLRINKKSIVDLVISLISMIVGILVINMIITTPLVRLVIDVMFGAMIYIGVNFIRKNELIMSVIEKIKGVESK